MNREADVTRIHQALIAAAEVIRPYASGTIEVQTKTGDDPVTEADRRADQVLHRLLLGEGEGWLSEETRDDERRLGCSRVWVVDPLDGTREFVERLPEWCISIGLVEDGLPVAGGIFNPATGEVFVGSVETGLTLNGQPARVRPGGPKLDGGTVLASRSEVKRGEWKRFEGREFAVKPLGSVAYKIALVAAGLADATWTHVPKHEWDVAGGAALVRAGGGQVLTLEGETATFNRKKPKFTGFLASRPELMPMLLALRPAPLGG